MAKPKKKKLFKALIIVFVSIFCLLTAGVFVVGHVFYEAVLVRGSYFYNTIGMGAYSTDDAEYVEKRIEKLKKDGAVDVRLTAFDGVSLHAFRIENDKAADKNKWAIVVHGYNSSAVSMSGYAERFLDMGYNILMPDLRGHGATGGDISMGWYDRLDLVKWSEMLVGENPNAAIIFYGVSMGGATVMMASGENLPSNVKAIVEDCGYTSVYDEFYYQAGVLYGIPGFPSVDIVNVTGYIRGGFSYRKASAVEQVKKSNTPIFFIHGGSDTLVPTKMVYPLYEAANCEKELLVVDGAEHGESVYALGAQYWVYVKNFLDRYVSE
ncbi:MAG: alpha/beta hydrolase [Clostridiales bacterium]|jgi:fermentation-respiration switch protein FrsA (DUF1100 family)|nr:alpha/beta hydrolase [Clostridiales bacterium]